MEPVSRPVRIALTIITITTLALAAWVVLSPAETGVDGRTALALILGLGAIGAYLAQRHPQDGNTRR